MARNEIDYILTNKTSILLDIDVTQKVNIGSDHRLIRGNIRINTRMERSKMTRAKKPKLNIGRLLMKKEEFQIKLQNRFELLDSEGHIEDVTQARRQLNWNGGGGGMDSQYIVLSELLSDQAAFITSPKTSLANYWGGIAPLPPSVYGPALHGRLQRPSSTVQWKLQEDIEGIKKKS